MSKLVKREKITCLRSYIAQERQSQDLFPDLILYPAFTSTSGCLDTVSSIRKGLWDVLVEGLKCQVRRLAFILKTSGGFEA